jgi:hypothetical protein
VELNNRPYLVVQAILKRLHQAVQQDLPTALLLVAQMYQAQHQLNLVPQEAHPVVLLRFLLVAQLFLAAVLSKPPLAQLPIQVHLPLKVQALARQTLVQVDRRGSRLNARLGVI